MSSTAPNGHDLPPDRSTNDQASSRAARSRRAPPTRAVALIALTALGAVFACSSPDALDPKLAAPAYDSGAWNTDYETGSGTGYDGGGGGSTATGVALVDDYVRAMCDFFDRCDKFANLVYGKNITCQQNYAPIAKREFNASGFAASFAQVQACLAKMATSCASVTDMECRWIGKLDLGAACGYASQCSSGVCSNKSDGQCGKCVPTIPEGGACTPSTACAPGTTCFSGTCRRLGGEGQPCATSGNDCAFDLRCLNGTCSKRAPAGAPCTTINDCDWGQGLFCTSGTKTCKPWDIADLGKPCGFDGADSWTECSTAWCTNSTADAGSVCVDRGKEGAPCVVDSADEYQCVPGLVCVNNVCTSDPAQICL